MTKQLPALPASDSRTHLESLACWCQPTVERQPNGSMLVIHNAADGREFFEASPGHAARSLCAECKKNPVETVERAGRRRESLWCAPCKAKLIEETRGQRFVQSDS